MCVFVFQAEDGIRDHCVTGVQTCALPISAQIAGAAHEVGHEAEIEIGALAPVVRKAGGQQGLAELSHRRHADRKSTRLNSSHTVISYAVFCLKKKKKKKKQKQIIKRSVTL